MKSKTRLVRTVHTMRYRRYLPLFSVLEFLPDILNDLDVDFSADPKAAAAYTNDQRNLRKIREHSAKLQVTVMAPLREGKRLLVLDIDYSSVPPGITIPLY